MEKWKFKWELKPSIENPDVKYNLYSCAGSLVIEQVKEKCCDTCKNRDVEGWKNPCIGCTGFAFYEPKEND